METVREIIKRRDGCDDDVVDGMFEALVDEVAFGADPEDALADEFGLEPDYIMDEEVWEAISKGLLLRKN